MLVLENMIKTRNILLTIPLFSLVIMIIFAIIKINNNREESKINVIEQSDNTNRFDTNNFLEDINESREIETKKSNDNIESNESDKTTYNKKAINENIDILNEIDMSYYTQENWLVEEIVVKERKEKLSIFERIDGKVPKVTKEIKKCLKWLANPNDKNSYIKNSFVFVKIATSSDIAYKYYFDENGYLIIDNISKDWTILDKYGREIDTELKPIIYYIGNVDYSTEQKTEVYDSKENTYYSYKDISINSTPSQIIIMDGVVLRNKIQSLFDNLIDRNMSKYIKAGSGYQRKAKGTIFTKNKWNDAIKLIKNESYIVFNNYINNFNRITGKVAMEYVTDTDRDTICKIVFYDKDEYDKGNIDEYLFETKDFNYAEAISFNFTFDRSIKDIVVALYINGTYKNRSIYLKDLRYGFSKSAYKEELMRKREEKEEIDYLKSLGLYGEENNYFDIIDEEGEIYEIEKFYDIYDVSNTSEYHSNLLDQRTGPAFDEDLKKRYMEIKSPYFEKISTKSEIKEKNIKSKTIYTK